MGRLRRIGDALYVPFITFSCYRRRRLLDHDQPRPRLSGVLNEELARSEARCVGFVVMPSHVQALILFFEGRSAQPVHAAMEGPQLEGDQTVPVGDRSSVCRAVSESRYHLAGPVLLAWG